MLLLRTSLKKPKIAKSKFTCRKRTQRKLEKAQKSQRRSLQRPPSDLQNHHLGKRQHVHRMLQRDKKCLSGGASKDPRGLPKSASWAPRTCKITNVAPTCMPNASRKQKRLSGDLSRDPQGLPESPSWLLGAFPWRSTYARAHEQVEDLHMERILLLLRGLSKDEK